MTITIKSIEKMKEDAIKDSYLFYQFAVENYIRTGEDMYRQRANFHINNIIRLTSK